jgi:hypothetical protein
MDEAAGVALRAVVVMAPKLKSVKRVRFTLFGASALAAHEKALENL